MLTQNRITIKRHNSKLPDNNCLSSIHDLSYERRDELRKAVFKNQNSNPFLFSSFLAIPVSFCIVVLFQPFFNVLSSHFCVSPDIMWFPDLAKFRDIAPLTQGFEYLFEYSLNADIPCKLIQDGQPG